MRFAVVQIFSLIFPLLTTGICILGGFGWYQIARFHLPISKLLAFLTTVLPFVNLVVARFLISRAYRNTKGSRRINVTPLIALSFIILFSLDVAVLTLATTYFSEPGKTCLLENRWQKFFHNKSLSIKEIQDALKCCGLHSQVDRPFPFPTKGVEVSRCADMLGSKDFCFPKWKGKMDLYSSVLTVAASIVVLVNLVTVMLAFSRSPRIVKTLYYPFSGPQDYFYFMQDHDGDESESSRNDQSSPRRRLLYTDESATDADGENEDDNGESSRNNGRKRLEGANKDRKPSESDETTGLLVPEARSRVLAEEA